VEEKERWLNAFYEERQQVASDHQAGLQFTAAARRLARRGALLQPTRPSRPGRRRRGRRPASLAAPAPPPPPPPSNHCAPAGPVPTAQVPQGPEPEPVVEPPTQTPPEAIPMNVGVSLGGHGAEEDTHSIGRRVGTWFTFGQRKSRALPAS